MKTCRYTQVKVQVRCRGERQRLVERTDNPLSWNILVAGLGFRSWLGLGWLEEPASQSDMSVISHENDFDRLLFYVPSEISTTSSRLQWMESKSCCLTLTLTHRPGKAEIIPHTDCFASTS